MIDRLLHLDRSGGIWRGRFTVSVIARMVARQIRKTMGDRAAPLVPLSRPSISNCSSLTTKSRRKAKISRMPFAA